MQKDMILQQFGIIERANYSFEGYGDAGYTIITTKMQEEDMKSDLYVALKKPKNYEKEITNLLRP